MPKFSGTTYIPWDIDPDTIGGLPVESPMSPSPGDVLEYDGAKWTAAPLAYQTTTDPTLTSDTSSGFFVGQRWINTTASRVWDCVDATAGAAVWRRVGGYGSTFQADAGTVALYRFDGNGNDSGGGGLNLTAAGTINYCPGFANRSVFRGVSNTNFSLASATLDLSADLCLEALILPRAGTAYTHTYVQYGPNASRRYYLDFDNTTSAYIESGYWNGSTHIEISTGILTDEWSHFCMTRTSSGGSTTLSLYVNGALAGTRTDAGGPTSGSSTLYVGRNATGTTSQVMNGEFMAGLHLSTTVPSAAEVRRRAQLYHPYPGICQ